MATKEKQVVFYKQGNRYTKMENGGFLIEAKRKFKNRDTGKEFTRWVSIGYVDGN